MYVFDLRFDLDVWVHAEGKVLDRPTHARITRRRFTPPSPTSPHLALGSVNAGGVPFQIRNTFVAPITIVDFTFI